MPAPQFDFSDQPQVFIYTEDHVLNSKLIEKLRSKNCIATLISEEKVYTSTLSLRDFFSSLSDDSLVQKYLIFLLGESSINFTGKEKEIEELIKLASGKSLKTLFIFPYNQSKQSKKAFDFLANKILTSGDFYAGIVFSGEIFENIHSPLNPLFVNEQIKIPAQGTILHPVSIDVLSELIVSSLFSMHAYKERIAILGEPLEISSLTSRLSKKRPVSKMVLSDEFYLPVDGVVERRLEAGSLEFLLNSLEEELSVIQNKSQVQHENNKLSFTIKKVQKLMEVFSLLLDKSKSSFKRLNNYKATKVKKNEKTQEVVNRKNPKKHFLTAVVFLAFVIFYPVVSLGAASIILTLANSFTKVGSYNTSTKALSLSSIITKSTKNYALFMLDRNVLEGFYEDYYDKSSVLEKQIQVQGKFLNILEKQFFLQTSENFDLFDNLSELTLELETIYADLSFLQSEKSTDEQKKYYANPLFKEVSVGELKEKVFLVSKMLKEKDKILGKEKPVRYLFILQDSDFIKATGGKIKSVGVVNISNGKVVDTQIYDTKFVDSKLSGQVEPPEALKKYFGIEKWLLEDSNWYNDFPESAEKIEWFIDKELDVDVEGVIAIDTFGVQQIINTVPHDSEFYQHKKGKLRELQDDPQKYLEVFFELLGSNETLHKAVLVPKLVELLNTKHLLIFHHNEVIKKATSEFNWDGAVRNDSCAAECYLDLIGISETSSSIGSVNFFREAVLKISIEESLIKRELTYFLENQNSYTYKTYLRFIVNQDSGFSPASLVSNRSEELKDFDINGIKGQKEGGIFVEVLPGESKAIRFSWESGRGANSDLKEYRLFFRKQPGIESLPLEVEVKSARGFSLKDTSLTNRQEFLYNTKLTQDYSLDLLLINNE